MRGGREPGRAGQYATGWSLNCPPSFFFVFLFSQQKFGSMHVQTSKKGKGSDLKEKMIGMTCAFSDEESAKRRCSEVASGPGNQRRRRHQ